MEQNKAIVREYFRRIESGDAKITDLLSDDVTWWVPQSSALGGTHSGKAAVLALMGQGVDLYQPPLHVVVEEMIAERDWVCAQVVIEAKTAAGLPYRNDYHFAFRVRDGQIVAVREYVDTQYAAEKLFPKRASAS
jgi:ketosteroid isomerase-like protein